MHSARRFMFGGRHPRLPHALAAAVCAIGLTPAVLGVGVSPLTIAETLPPGGELVVKKTVETAPIPPRPDIVFLCDTTGSMMGTIDSVKGNAASILNAILMAQPGAQFAVAEYRDEGDAFVYQLNQAVTADSAAAVAAINGWSAGGGGDTPEAQLYALEQVATDAAVGFRTTASSRVIVWFGDAPGHDPTFGGITEALATAALQDAGIQVLAIDVGGLDDTGQATRIALATGGSYLLNPDPATVAQAILDGLSDLPVRITPMILGCTEGLTLSVTPAEAIIQSGETTTFEEQILVAPDAPQCETLRCVVEWWLNGLPVLQDDGTRDPNWVQTILITVADVTPPDVVCLPTTNPAGKNVPKAGENPKSGQNPDGFYQLLGKDNCDAPEDLLFRVCDGADPSVCFGPFANGDKVKITQAPGAPQTVKPMAGEIVAHLKLKGEPFVTATDTWGNTGASRCLVPPPPK